MSGPQCAMLPDGRRLHLHHGPIDLILEAFGPKPSIVAAFHAARSRFDTLLQELADELPQLRRPHPGPLKGEIAHAMASATSAHRPVFITPMAAVAGAVADNICTVLARTPGLSRAYVNNGGDIAFHLAANTSITAAIAATSDRVTIAHSDPIRGLASSGWRGRSFSLGIADTVTVIARTAAQADAAATVIANAVDLPGHPAITRIPATDLQADSDLGTRAVTTAVGALSPGEADTALANGTAAATAMERAGLIAGAALFLGGECRMTGNLPARQTARPQLETAHG
jgi:ApbE superfamily uncharacterized protein (UPF0280 family)